MDKNKIFSIYKQAFHNFIVSLSSIVSTGFFVGKIKYASGTFGSLLAIILCVPFCKLNIVFQFLIVLSIAIFGMISTHIYLKNLGDMNKDPKEVVIDEILAIFMMVFLANLITKSVEYKHLAVIFVLFRFFDILKPYPICWIDKNIHGAKGIMLDDIFAGFAGMLFYAIIFG